MTLVITAYSVMWSGLLAATWLGWISQPIGPLDTVGALAYLPLWTRLMVWVWTGLLLVALAKAWKGRPEAWRYVAFDMAPHLSVFLTLIGNPYYNGLPGYANFAAETATAALLYLAFRRRSR